MIQFYMIRIVWKDFTTRYSSILSIKFSFITDTRLLIINLIFLEKQLSKSAIIIREIQFMIRMSNPVILQQFHLRISCNNCSHELIKIIMYMDAKSLHMHMWKLWIASILHLLIHNSNWHLMTPWYSARPINRQKNLFSFGPLPCHTVYHYSIITPTIRVGGHLRSYKTIQGRLTTIDL